MNHRTNEQLIVYPIAYNQSLWGATLVPAIDVCYLLWTITHGYCIANINTCNKKCCK